MNDRNKQLRLERMKREKQRQLRTRRKRQMFLRRFLTVGGGVAVVLVLISAIWMLVSPLVKKAGADKTGDKSVVEVQADPQDEAANGDPEETKTSEVESQDKAAMQTIESNDQEAVREPIADPQNLEYAVPGWQVDTQGWWYANEDGTYFKNGWLEMDGKQYHLDENGYMQTGWNVVGQKGCFFTESGEYDPDKESKMVALTFDDGPGKFTNEILDILEANGAKATFFMLGECVDSYGQDTIPRMQELGCELGNHSYDHPNLTDLSEDQIKDQFNRTDDSIAAITGGDISTLARTPFGAQDEAITGYIGKPCIYWNLDTEDWRTKDVQSNISVVLDRVQDGDIILMHDIWETTKESVKTIIPELVKRGFQLVTVSELASAKGVNMENGITYYDFIQTADET